MKKQSGQLEKWIKFRVLAFFAEHFVGNSEKLLLCSQNSAVFEIIAFSQCTFTATFDKLDDWITLIRLVWSQLYEIPERNC